MPCGLETFLEELAMLGHPTGDPFAPESKAGRFQLAPHHIDHLFLGESCACLDLLKGRPVFPRKPDHEGNLISVDVSHIEQCTFRSDDFSMTDSVRGLVVYRYLSRKSRAALNPESHAPSTRPLWSPSPIR